MKARRILTIGLLALVTVTTGALVAQTPQAIGTWAPLRDLANPLPNGASVALPDGRTLIAGGTAAGDRPTDGVTLYDPTNDTLILAGKLLVPRSGHTASLLKDGRILVVGGVTDAGVISTDIERFDPVTGTSEIVGQLAEPRRGHVAAALLDGTVLIAGGATTDGLVLQSAAVFNPETNNLTPLAAGLQLARVNATATTLLDGRVLIAGGSNGSADLASAEIFERYWQTFAMAATQMSVARQGHAAVMLPHNGGVLFAGGTSNGAAPAGTDLFLPAVFPDPFSYGEGEFTATGALAAPRAAAVAGPTSVEGYAFGATAGAKDAEVYRFATIKTDKNDYAPGELAVITGSGWQPDEEVTLLIQEDPAVHEDYVLKLAADSDGNISWNQWAPERHDFGVRFYLTATGTKSRAQTTFTDAAADTSVSVGCSPGSVASGSPTICTTTVTNTANGAPGGWPRGSIDWTLTGGLTGSFSATACNLTQVGTTNSSRCSVTFTPNTPTALPNGKVKGTYEPSPADWKGANDQFTLPVTTATKTTPTITFTSAPTPTFGGGNFSVSATTTNTDSSALTYSVVSGPCNWVSGSTFSSSGAGACEVRASGAATANFNAASNTQTVTIAKAPATIVVSCPVSVEYTGAPQELCTAAVTGAGGLNQSLTVSYTNNTNAGTATASASYAESANHLASNGSKDFTIVKAPTTVTVTCPASVEYNGSAQTPCSATVTGAGGLNQPLPVSYSNNTNAGTATASASYAESANHLGETGSTDFTITKAPTTVVVSCPASVEYNGAAQTPCSATVTGNGGLNQSVPVNYSNNTNAGTATAIASYAESANHLSGNDSETFNIAKAPVTVTVTCPVSVTYNGSAQEPCTATVSGAGLAEQSLTVSYSDNTNAGTATASASYAESANHRSGNDSETFNIAKAPVTVTVTCPVSVTYSGSAQEPCTASVTGAGGLNQSLTVSYSNNTNAGMATAGATYTESANHQAGSDEKTFTIAKAPVTVAVTCPASVTYNGSAQTPCSAAVTGAGWLNQALTVSYADNTNAGTATASASYAESANHLGNTGSTQFTIDRRTLTITPEGGKTKLLGATFTAFTGSVTGLQGTDAGTATYASPGAPAAAAVGSYDITATFVFTSGSASNYDVQLNTAVKGLVVVYRWDGFLQPINDTAHDLTVMSKFKLGQTIPAKFVLKNAAGAVVLQTGSPEFTRSANLGACDTNSIPEDVPALTADVVPQYKWDGSQYHYNWSTKGLTSGLYRVFAKLGDGTTQSVDICLTK